MTEGASTIDLSHPIRRVAFTCDFLRFAPEEHGYSSFQPRNLAWLVEVLTGASAWKRHGAEVSLVMPPMGIEAFSRALGNAAALADYRESADHAWARRYDVAEPDIFAPVFEQLCEHDLVVGFEMAPTIRRRLHAKRRPYINFYIHPLRFLRDLCLGVTTNVPTIAASLRAHEIAQHEIDTQVRRFRALFLRQQLAACAIPPELPVLVGQTERDSVLIRGGRFIGWEDFADELDHRLAAFDEVVFLEHPYRPTSGTILEHLRSMHGKTVIATNANGYGVMFSNSEIPAVLTLASSLGVEALALGLSTHFLLDDPRHKFLVPEVDVPAQGTYGHGVLTAEFWDAVLSGDSPKIAVPKKAPFDDFPLGEHYLRNSLEAWSFRALQYGLGDIGSRKTLVPTEALMPQRRDALLSALTGAATPVAPQRAIERAHALGMQLDFLDPPLALGELREVALNGPSATTYLAYGFHALESWGGWSSDIRSQLVLPVGPAALQSHARLDISMRVRAFDGLLPDAPVLRISSGNQLVGYVFFRASGLNQQTINFTLTPSSPLCRIDLEMTDLESPAAKGLSADQRWLGFALSRLTVVCAAPTTPAEAESPSATCQLWGISAEPVAVVPSGGHL